MSDSMTRRKPTTLERRLIAEAPLIVREAPTELRGRIVTAIERLSVTPSSGRGWAFSLGAALAGTAAIAVGIAAWLVHDVPSGTPAWSFLPVAEASVEWPRQAREMPSQWETMLRGEAQLVVLDARSAGNQVLDRLALDSWRPVVWSGAEGGR